MAYQKSNNLDQITKTLYSPQTEPNRIMNSEVAKKFLAVSSAAGLSIDIAKRLLWENQSGNEEWQEAKSIYEGTYDTTYQPSTSNGLPIFDRYIELEISNETGEVDIAKIRLEIVFINVKRKPTVIYTMIPGKQYTIKEKLSSGDYEINLKGSIISKNPYRFPKEELNILDQILSTDNLINVSSSYLNNVLKVAQVVTKNYNFKEDNKFSNMANFEINFVSDEIEGILI
jgi:Domain of unknown function (DUF6046)